MQKEFINLHQVRNFLGVAKRLIKQTNGAPFRSREVDFSQRELKLLQEMGLLKVVSSGKEIRTITKKGKMPDIQFIDVETGEYIRNIHYMKHGKQYLVNDRNAEEIEGLYYIYQATFRSVEELKDQIIEEFYRKISMVERFANE